MVTGPESPSGPRSDHDRMGRRATAVGRGDSRLGARLVSNNRDADLGALLKMRSDVSF